jgi:uncharacterized integral membrane protein (TIGR00698 family)
MHEKIKALLLALIPGLVVFGSSLWVPSLNPVLVGLVVGIVLGNTLVVAPSYTSVVHYTGNRLLEWSVLFLAFGINYTHLTGLGWKSLLIILATVVAVLLVSFFASRKPAHWLIGFGTAICGASAVVALAPSVAEEKTDTGIAMAVVNLYGTIGMLLLPLVFMTLDVEVHTMALLTGGSLHSVGNVAVAGYMIDREVGELALTVKLARVAFLSFGLILFNILTKKNKDTSWTTFFSLPWYIWGFIAITVLVSVIVLPPEASKLINLLGKILLTIAMTNIGMLIRMRDLVRYGKKGLFFGWGIWFFQLGLLLVLMRVVG